MPSFFIYKGISHSYESPLSMIYQIQMLLVLVLCLQLAVVLFE
jgi:hypothetical protein